ncbi:MAG: tetratricopeptide repeat protein [Limisphaerales bacterium]
MASAVTQTPTPPTEAPEQDRMLNALAWVEIHRKQLMMGVVALIAVFAATYLWRQLAAQRELEGNAALLVLRSRPTQPETAAKAADYLKVAEQHASTTAGLRARLLAASAYFAENRYSDAQAEFERVLAADGSGVLGAQAAFGVAASLDAQDQQDAAIAKYQDVISRFPHDAVALRARLGLARIHETRKQPENALRFYDEILRDREPGEAGVAATQARTELIRQHPELAASGTPASATTTPPNATATPAPATAGAPGN